MSSWYRKVTADPSNLEPLVDTLAFVEDQYLDGRKDLNMEGKRIWEEAKKLPGYMSYRYGQYREIEAIRDWLDMRIRKLVKDNMETIWTTYNKAMSERQVEKWAEVADDVMALKEIRIELAYIPSSYKLQTANFAVSIGSPPVTKQ